MQKIDILIIGAGVAGLACAGLLEKQGATPLVIEKDTEKKFNNSGYMLGLLPLGGRVLSELDADKAYFDRSIEMKTYEIHKEDGRLNKAYPLDFINEKFGSYRGIERKELIRVLREKLRSTELRFGTTTEAFRVKADKVEVTFSDGTSREFDIVIAADGIHSSTRKQLWKPDEYSFYETGWGGWVAWLENKHMNAYKEYWGASSFMGLYPVKNKIGVFLGGPDDLIDEKGMKGFAEEIRKHVHEDEELLRGAFDALLDTERPFLWKFHDVRTESWTKGNIILLGDAAAGFLPTAGVGASMALDSASALIDELSRTDREHLQYGLQLYVKRQKKRVEKAQKDSRDLAKIMFVKSHMLATIRDYSIRFYSLKQLASNISKTMEGS